MMVRESMLMRVGLSFFFQGRLPAETGENVPTIAIIAHYDSFGMAPVSGSIQG